MVVILPVCPALDKKQNQNDSSLKQAILSNLILFGDIVEKNKNKKIKFAGGIFLSVVSKLESLTNQNSTFNNLNST